MNDYIENDDIEFEEIKLSGKMLKQRVAALNPEFQKHKGYLARLKESDPEKFNMIVRKGGVARARQRQISKIIAKAFGRAVRQLLKN